MLKQRALYRKSPACIADIEVIYAALILTSFLEPYRYGDQEHEEEDKSRLRNALSYCYCLPGGAAAAQGVPTVKRNPSSPLSRTSSVALTVT